MTVRVAGLGIGLFMLGILWLLSFFICFMASRTPGIIGKAGYLAVFVMSIVTLVLWLIPRDVTYEDRRLVVTDMFIIRRIVILIVAAVMCIVGLIGLTMQHVFEVQKTNAIIRRY